MKRIFVLTKRVFCFLFVTAIFSTLLSSATIAKASSLPSLNSEGVTLMDADTGQILYSKNGNKRYYPASTTKIITATIILSEYDNLDTVVTVGKNPPYADGSSIGLAEGEKITLEHLLLGLLLESGNDCAEALAEYNAGSKEAFAEKMNDLAKKIGANDSNFVNPSGLPDPNHYTTPNDLALFMCEAIKNPKFNELSRISMIKMPPRNTDGYERYINNHNSILLKNSKYFYQHSLSGKRGYTSDARFTNVIASEKDGHRLVASFLTGPSIEKVIFDAKNTFDYGYGNFTKNTLYKKDQVIEEIALEEGNTLPILCKEDIFYTSKNQDSSSLEYSLEYSLPPDIEKTTFKKGQIITTAKVLVNGEEFTTVNLLAGSDREYTTKIATTHFLQENQGTLIVLAVLIFILILLLFFIHRRRMKVKRMNAKWDYILKNKKVRR